MIVFQLSTIIICTKIAGKYVSERNNIQDLSSGEKKLRVNTANSCNKNRQKLPGVKKVKLFFLNINFFTLTISLDLPLMCEKTLFSLRTHLKVFVPQIIP